MLSFFTNNWETNRDLLRPKALELKSSEPPRAWNCVLLHGWHSLYYPLHNLEKALRQVPGGEEVRFWQCTYDSHWKTFSRSGRDCMAALKSTGVAPENTILIGYSMGGLVARSMVAQGFMAKHVFCVATPHLGAAPWMPVGDIGSLSIAPWSPRLAKLNAAPRDIAHREHYSFFGLDFRDATGYQNHDRIVKLRSALGHGLSGNMERHTVHLCYSGVAPGCDPHLRGMDPHFLKPMLQRFEEVAGGQPQGS